MLYIIFSREHKTGDRTVSGFHPNVSDILKLLACHAGDRYWPIFSWI